MTRLPRFGQDHPFVRQLTSRLGRLWVEEVERASAGMSRLSMWPGFYSHMVHIHAGRSTPATPDGRRAGEPLSENQGPSYLTTGCTPTSVLNSMSALPFDHTPSGAASLTLSATDVRGESGLHRLWQLLDGYFQQGGLHLQVNVLEPGVLEQAMKRPEQYANLVVRVTGFSAYFTRLSRDVQEDLLRRWRRDS